MIRNIRRGSALSCRRWRSWTGPSAATCGSTPAGPGRCRRNSRHAAELVALAPDVILAHGAPAVAALLQATCTVPIVFVAVIDPVGGGFVDSLARPGGNTTGFTQFEYGISGKWLELLKADRAARDASGGPSESRHSLRDRPVGRHPGGGAVVRGGSEPGQCARRRRDRARRRGLRALSERRPDRAGERRWRSFIAI